MARRGAGEGSVFKDPRSGRWRALVDVGADASGKRQRKKVSGRTRAEVLLKLREVQRDVEDGLDSGGRHLTVAVLAEEWLRTAAASCQPAPWRCARGRSASTSCQPSAPAASGSSARRTCRCSCRTWPWPATPGPAWRRCAACSSRCSGTLDGRGWWPATSRLWSRRRPGLKWEDVDLDQGVLRISRAVSRVGGTAQLGATKTASSRRQLRLPAGTGDALRQHRARQLAQRDVMGEHWAGLDLVFPTSRGTLLDPANLRRALRTVTETAGLGRWHPHELRHSAASLLSAAGVPLEEVADVLGHASTRVTSATYLHRTTQTVEAGAGPMDQLLAAPRLNSVSQSDNLMPMRTVTATEASRSFAALLDEVERGETVVVTRGGKRIASIGPASVGNGAEVLALLAHDVDEDFAADVAAARAAVTTEDPAWPAD